MSFSFPGGWFTVTSPSAQAAARRAVSTLTAGAMSGGLVSGTSQIRACSTVTSPWCVTSSPAWSRRMMSTHSSSRRCRVSFGGHGLAGDVLVHVLAAARGHPEAAGKHVRQGGRGVRDDGRVVPLARAPSPRRSAGRWWPARRPSQDQAKPEWPCRADHGSMWSEHMAASKPACSASCTSLQERPGLICSCEAWNPMVAIVNVYRRARGCVEEPSRGPCAETRRGAGGAGSAAQEWALCNCR